MPTDTLQLKNIKASIDDEQILKGVDLTVKPGEVHAIMGPNGSGKSTLASVLAGHPDYQVASKSEVRLGEMSLLELAPDERAQAGLFLAFQYPVAIPGVKVQNFLWQAYQARFGADEDKAISSVLEFKKFLEKTADKLSIKKEMLSRGLNEGFSGGERKRLEILQMAVLQPKFAILDETDSGLDVDAIQDVAHGVKQVIDDYQTGVIVITHYQRILDYLQPDKVHVLIDGKIAESGGPELAQKVDSQGYLE